MAEPTQAPGIENTPTAYGYCSWHAGYAEGVRLIHAIEQGSGPGRTVFACAPCREQFRLVPLADQP
ncbi:hypothetical protein OG985_21805 [Streptomyces sp. NBC_00289]|uniref:hypothetical protein n=1 Tax=Streptomyces sp. NBC_00289 TaxID=2975703 RepID=UPI00324A2019